MKGIILFSNLMEDNEALGTNALLRRSGINISSVSLEVTKTVKTSYNQEIIADLHISEINIKDYDFLVIPGGPYVSKTINDNEKIYKIINEFKDQNKLIAAICAAPRFLGRTGILDNLEYTAFPGSENDM